MRLDIEREGQPYIDDLVVVRPLPETVCAEAVRALFGRPKRQRIVIGFNRVPLVWTRAPKKG